MSYESDDCKLLIDEAIHDYLHDDTENEMAVKDWFYDLCKQATKADEYETKAKAWDAMKKDFEDIADTPMGQQILFNMSIIKERVERRDSNA